MLCFLREAGSTINQSFHCLVSSIPYSSLPALAFLVGVIIMIDSYYESQPNSGTNGGSISPNGGYGADGRSSIATPNGRAITPNSGFQNGGGGNEGDQPSVNRKKLASWVGFSNLPNQVHRRSMR